MHCSLILRPNQSVSLLPLINFKSFFSKLLYSSQNAWRELSINLLYSSQTRFSKQSIIPTSKLGNAVDKKNRNLFSSFVPSPPNPPPSFSTQRGGGQLPLPFIARAAQLGAHNFNFVLILPQSRKCIKDKHLLLPLLEFSRTLWITICSPTVAAMASTFPCRLDYKSIFKAFHSRPAPCITPF